MYASACRLVGLLPTTTRTNNSTLPLCQSSRQPAAAASSPPQEFSLLLTNCRVLDVAAGNYLEGLQSVLLQGGLIREVRPMGHAGATTTVMVAAAESADAESADAESADAESADAKSADAESADAESADAESADAESADAESADAESADAESADAEAEAGIAPIEGFRTHPPTAVEVDCGGAVLMPAVGRLLPTCQCWLTNTQFSEAELKAIVEEAGAAGTYVCAHAYTPAAIQRAVKCGVASIEHGNYLDEYTARLMSHRRVFLVPTLVTYREIVRHVTNTEFTCVNRPPTA
ncbi:hypothetical protein VOLCADRAFT_97225 [Volvox carteri f. nagariensis]|uniref:Amidohydrolase-related domain-containing protein n=1 Tax=Volvox carteri f. nagariensis TaxID=3068 RepID=D8UC70_VOLCA|nr:uncharacterized protein VOLCADRAFT_97225 [Volvox carteri f. nagariensis]EFJ42643.1 hypothetical protein VOLCADRAFT_97225 [Volvox carteri f. nagariensis]|eukprot:XP_002956294.1 hypothetical protein VOLCADRAFT_97225 [Volvox carteri f. nagariensis]